MAALEKPAGVIPGQLTVDDCIAEAVKAEPKVFTSVTPSGITVGYSPAPRRYYTVNGEEVPSVTSVLGCLSKDGLSWWGQGVGAQGVIDLYNAGEIAEGQTGESKRKLAIPLAPEGEPWPVATAANVVPLLTKFKKTVNHQLSKAGDRGTSVHDAFEQWAVNGVTPHPEIYPDSERPYVEGLVKFLHDWGVAFGIQAEVMVGSVKHGFAGRYDVRCRWGGGPMVVKTYPKRANKIEELPAGRYLLDLKSSKSVYPTHALQLIGYEIASVECGYEPTDYRAVVHVTANGEYEVVLCHAEPQDFLSVLDTYQTMERGKKTWL